MSRRKGGSRKDTRSLTLPGFPQPDGGKPSRWPLVDDELADQLLGKARAEGFDFLGFTVRRQRKRGTQKHYVYTTPSKKAIKAIRDKVSAKTYRSPLHMDPAEVITILSQMLRGWAAYFRHSVSKCSVTSMSTPGGSSRPGSTASTTGSAGSSCTAGSACQAAGRSPRTGPCSPGASSVAVTRSRDRGANPNPRGQPNRQPPPADQQARQVERPVR
jgi:RNA-directed DNA polymerase